MRPFLPNHAEPFREEGVGRRIAARRLHHTKKPAAAVEDADGAETTGGGGSSSLKSEAARSGRNERLQNFRLVMSPTKRTWDVQQVWHGAMKKAIASPPTGPTAPHDERPTEQTPKGIGMSRLTVNTSDRGRTTSRNASGIVGCDHLGSSRTKLFSEMKGRWLTETSTEGGRYRNRPHVPAARHHDVQVRRQANPGAALPRAPCRFRYDAMRGSSRHITVHNSPKGRCMSAPRSPADTDLRTDSR